MKSSFFFTIISCCLISKAFCILSQEALDRLIEGNQRYVGDKMLHPDISLMRRKSLTAKQKPFAIILGCSDSRVSPEIIFDQGIGDLFVIRIAGNIISPEIIDSIEYSALYLGSKIIVVLGHENCGAVKAVYEGQYKDIEAIAERVSRAIKKCKKEKKTLDDCIRANVYYVVDQIRKYPLIKKLIKDQNIEVVGALYSLETGKVELLP